MPEIYQRRRSIWNASRMDSKYSGSNFQWIYIYIGDINICRYNRAMKCEYEMKVVESML